MAYKEQVIYNPVTGQNIKFIHTSWDTHGQLLEMESTYTPKSKEPPAHYHPNQEEDFRVIYGKVKVRMDGKVTTFKGGESFHIPKGKVHSMWNESENKAILNWQVKPAMSTEFLLETTFALVNDGKANDKGMPKFLQLVLTANRFSNVLRLTKPPYAVQKILFTLLTPIAYCLGYRAYYQKYIYLKKDQKL